MKQKTKQTPKPAASACVCQGAGPILTEFLRRIGPPGEARRHFEAARHEFLKGLRAILAARIAQVSKSDGKGQKINVE